MSADFFTRLINSQALGPNMLTTSEQDDGCIVTYQCPSCEEEHDDECSAEDCCPRVVEEIIRCSTCRKKHFNTDEAEECCPASAREQPMRCPVCLQGADSFEIAADCCLHVHPTMTALGRQRVAQAVASGTPWPDAVAANINH